MIHRITAHAKINLTLAITGKREGDNMHLLDSLVVFAESCDSERSERGSRAMNKLHDVITITENDMRGKNIPDDNLVMQAADSFHAHANITTRDYGIALEKNIPIAAGLGGGSADAAAALVLLNRMHEYPLTDSDLFKIGAGLGADIPLCLTAHGLGMGRSMQSGRQYCYRMRGAGEFIRPHIIEDSDGLGIILAKPDTPLSTAEVFAEYDKHPASREGFIPPTRITPATLPDYLARGNDLRDAAIRLAPDIKTTLDALGALQGEAGFLGHGMSGSGATCFALFASAQTATAALAALTPRPHWCWSGGLS